MASQSIGLSKRHESYHEEGNHLCMDSNHNESAIRNVIPSIIKYAEDRAKELDGEASVITKRQISLFDLQCEIHKYGGPPPLEKNKGRYIRPDAPIIFLEYKDKLYPLLIVEDKLQGTNDRRTQVEKKKRQSTGNAIERFAKNMNAAKTMCLHMSVYPYCLFASGCDFHHSESISSRIVAGNMVRENHYLEVSSNGSIDDYRTNYNKILENIDINNPTYFGNQYHQANVFVKAHKYDDMAHGSSRWIEKEYREISCAIIDRVIEYIKTL